MQDSTNRSKRTQQPLRPLAKATITITNLINNTLYTFFVQAHYTNGGISMPPLNISVQAGRSLAEQDHDNDLIPNHRDHCPTSSRGWTSTYSSDYDQDGCQDIQMNADLDDDGVLNRRDSCPNGLQSWTSNSNTDYDGDGCQDGSIEDRDRDNDEIGDAQDLCPQGILGWRSNQSTNDYDQDGCRDEGEDLDNDNDRILDLVDLCPYGNIGWHSNQSSDLDNDGCRDADEDTDDDNDGLADLAESAGCARNPDCDGDGTGDGADNYPTDPSETKDGDGDGLGDNADPDDDDDEIPDHEDMDDDGDGLIEIATAMQFNSIRYALDGKGWRRNATAPLNSTGCDFSSCIGYELIANINLTSYAAWVPMGQQSDPQKILFNGIPFTAILEGNNHSLSGLSATNPQHNYLGLFSYLDGAKIYNLHLTGFTVSGNEFVGGLAGYGRNVTIAGLNLNGAQIQGKSYVGGLSGELFNARLETVTTVNTSVHGTLFTIGGIVGHAYDTEIYATTVLQSQVHGVANVGGFIGDAFESAIHNSHITASLVSGTRDTQETNVGGFIGASYLSRIISSYALKIRVQGPKRIGGLSGISRLTRIDKSYVAGSTITGQTEIGGLSGRAESSRVHSSYLAASHIHGDDDIGGLSGVGFDLTINSSYTVAGLVQAQGNNIGGLFGRGGALKIEFATVKSTNISGNHAVGGLVGYAENANTLYASAAIGLSIQGNGDAIGGLIGSLDIGNAIILSSYSIIELLQGRNQVGGLVGLARTPLTIYASYVYGDSLQGNHSLGGFSGASEQVLMSASYSVFRNIDGTDKIDGLLGVTHSSTEVSHSYWYIHNRRPPDNYGTPQLPTDLQEITAATGIYEHWNQGIDIDNADNDDDMQTGIDAHSRWCDRDRNGVIDEEEKQPHNAIWNFGGRLDYPSLPCAAPINLRQAYLPALLPEVVQVPLLQDYDEDAQSDLLDPDDDNDGVPDERDACPFGNTNWLAETSTDYDGDGCRDTDEDTDDDNDGVRDEQDQCRPSGNGFISTPLTDLDRNGCLDPPLPGLTSVQSIPAANSVLLSWKNPDYDPSLIREITLSWQSSDHRQRDMVSISPTLTKHRISGLSANLKYTITISVIYANSISKSIRLSIHTGSNHDQDSLSDAMDADDDNDGLPDSLDILCPFSPPNFHYASSADMDQDGCRDRDEDNDLAAITALVVTPQEGNLIFRWTNANVSLSNISIVWRAADNSTTARILRQTELQPLMSTGIRIMGLVSLRNYTFHIIPYYANGVKANETTIHIRTGPNYDNDQLADAVDPDDDNDGVPDERDECGRGQLGWQSNPNTDFDRDGCRDQDTDGDGIGDQADPDDDNDGFKDEADRFPLDNMEHRDTDDDGVGDNGDENDDNDNVMDSDDVDDDGDGLIEISSATELFNIRYQLDGTRYKTSAGDRGSSRGCGAPRTGITKCNGYELVRDLSLANYPNWLPIAHDTNPLSSGLQGTHFSTILEGNGHSIKDLTIRRPSESYQGLIGNVGGTAMLRNIHLENSLVIGDSFTGLFAGYGKGARDDARIGLRGVSISNGKLIGNENTGSLMGYGKYLNIKTASLTRSSLLGLGKDVGGLIGAGEVVSLEDCHSRSSSILGVVNNIGGLIGKASSTIIRSCSGSALTIGTGIRVGGLVGYATRDVRVESSSLINTQLDADSNIGGLVGRGGELMTILSSTVASTAIRGNGLLGGILGFGEADVDILSSAVVNASLAPRNTFLPRNRNLLNWAGGLSGQIKEAYVNSSAVIATSIHGSSYLGGLIGVVADNAVIKSSYVNNANIDGGLSLGGLIGTAVSYRIESSIVNGTTLTGDKDTGGLIGLSGIIYRNYEVGNGGEAIINSTSVRNSVLSGEIYTGGLVAKGEGVHVASSSVVHTILNGKVRTGGFFGHGQEVSIRSSFIADSQINGARWIGGLVGSIYPRGFGNASDIDSSSIINTTIIAGSHYAGGLVGEGNDLSIDASSIINTTIIAGSHYAGGLVGEGNYLSIDASSIINTTIIANLKYAGGLVGKGDRLDIRSSSIINTTLKGVSDIGGLIGHGKNAFIQSSVVRNTHFLSSNRGISPKLIRSELGRDFDGEVGGLVGHGEKTKILSSAVLNAHIHGTGYLGGLIGHSKSNTLYASYVSATRVAGNICIGSMIGTGQNTRIGSSYSTARLVATNNSRGILGCGEANIQYSYWDSNLSSVGTPSSQAKTTRELQEPTGYEGIYTEWDNGIDLIIKESGVDAITRWCDRDGSGRIEDAEQVDANRLWNFGGATSYPVLRCAGLDAQPAQPTSRTTIGSDEDDRIVLPPDEGPGSATPAPTDFLTRLLELLAPIASIDSADPLLAHQWYLDPIGIKELWAQDHTGQGTHVSILDTDVDMTHRDLVENIVRNKSRDYGVAADHPLALYPISKFDAAHGTAAAGIIAARGDNGIGIKGLAPRAGIYVSNVIGATNLWAIHALAPRTNRTAASSNSWGSTSYSRLTTALASFRSTVEEALDTGYNGKGVLYVGAGGNGRRHAGRSNYEEWLNQRGVIPVCAVGYDNTYATYSHPGSNLWICAPSGTRKGKCARSTSWDHNCGITTTDTSGSAGYNSGGSSTDLADPDYTQTFTGTSAATPIVSGVIAVLRGAFPALSWRDVKLILAGSAKQVDKGDSSWQTGATTYHNSNSRYNYNEDYGFGLIDAAAAFELARRWTSLPPEISTETATMETRFRAENSSIITLAEDAPDFVEFVEIFIQSPYQYFGQMHIELISPAGTPSILTNRHSCKNAQLTDQNCPDLANGYHFAAATHLGEGAAGDWTLKIKVHNIHIEPFNLIRWTPAVEDQSPTIPLRWRLKVYGHNHR